MTLVPDLVLIYDPEKRPGLNLVPPLAHPIRLSSVVGLLVLSAHFTSAIRDSVVYGDGLYTPTSDLFSAAVHCGVLDPSVLRNPSVKSILVCLKIVSTDGPRPGALRNSVSSGDADVGPSTSTSTTNLPSSASTSSPSVPTPPNVFPTVASLPGRSSSPPPAPPSPSHSAYPHPREGSPVESASHAVTTASARSLPGKRGAWYGVRIVAATPLRAASTTAVLQRSDAAASLAAAVGGRDGGGLLARASSDTPRRGVGAGGVLGGGGGSVVTPTRLATPPQACGTAPPPGAALSMRAEAAAVVGSGTPARLYGHPSVASVPLFALPDGRLGLAYDPSQVHGVAMSSLPTSLVCSGGPLLLPLATLACLSVGCKLVLYTRVWVATICVPQAVVDAMGHSASHGDTPTPTSQGAEGGAAAGSPNSAFASLPPLGSVPLEVRLQAASWSQMAAMARGARVTATEASPTTPAAHLSGPSPSGGGGSSDGAGAGGRSPDGHAAAVPSAPAVSEAVVLRTTANRLVFTPYGIRILPAPPISPGGTPTTILAASTSASPSTHSARVDVPTSYPSQPPSRRGLPAHVAPLSPNTVAASFASASRSDVPPPIPTVHVDECPHSFHSHTTCRARVLDTDTPGALVGTSAASSAHVLPSHHPSPTTRSSDSASVATDGSADSDVVCACRRSLGSVHGEVRLHVAAFVWAAPPAARDFFRPLLDRTAGAGGTVGVGLGLAASPTVGRVLFSDVATPRERARPFPSLSTTSSPPTSPPPAAAADPHAAPMPSSAGGASASQANHASTASSPPVAGGPPSEPLAATPLAVRLRERAALLVVRSCVSEAPTVLSDRSWEVVRAGLAGGGPLTGACPVFHPAARKAAAAAEVERVRVARERATLSAIVAADSASKRPFPSCGVAAPHPTAAGVGGSAAVATDGPPRKMAKLDGGVVPRR